jgi:DNA topoisomerase-1
MATAAHPSPSTMTKLLIVESPAKCKKIQGFLGAGWRVQATMGHIRALKEELEAIGFPGPVWRPTYEAIASKRDAIASLKKAAAGAEVYLGSDDDREGEAIAWHTCQILGLDPATTPRVVFHEITEAALKSAVASPGRIDMNKFNAQQARTMLDMLIGFTLSPCLWRGVGFKPGMSAGRCQTPALRIIYDRDQEIGAHTAKNTWRITATTEDGLDDSTIEWKGTGEDIPTQQAASQILAKLVAAPHTLTVTARDERIATSQPPKPFITSSLQQEASSRLSMNPKATMRAAQTLYEAGHITYMRTDNPILSQEAIDAASAVVTARWGEEYLGGMSEEVTAPKKKTVRKKTSAAATTKPEATKPEAQAAHEGIRPTHMEVTELGDVSAQEKRLYDLIWKRTIQSVMAPEKRNVVRLTAVPTAKPDAITMVTEWDKVAFAGWRILDQERKQEEEEKATALFEARDGIVTDVYLDWRSFKASEVRSSPPNRYTEASLVRELEHRGIGRPSTYATLVETVMEREYVEKATIKAEPVTLGVLTLTPTAKAPKATTRTEKGGGEKDKLRVTALGRTVMEWLLSTFGDMLEYDFTASMEAQLDEVGKGSRPWATVLGETWDRYKDRYNTIMSAPKAAAAADETGAIRSANKAEFGDGYKMVVSKKGPLFVLEREGEKTRFASVPANLSIQTATRQDAEAAFATATKATEGDTLGEIDGHPVIRKNGKFGYYVTWNSVTLNCKDTDTLEELEPRLHAKTSGDTVDHQVGSYRIKRGPYGLYMYKTGGPAGKKPVFVSVPDGTPYQTLTAEGAEQLYKTCAAAKKAAPKKK